MSSGTPMTPKPDNKTGGAMGGDSAGGAHGTGTSAATNQTQSGMTDANGHSTLGKKVDKLSPTSGAAITAKGDTLKRKAPPR